MDQIGLFGQDASREVGPVVLPGDPALAAQLPARLRLGTSSWSFEGWKGVVYDRAAKARVLSQQGLRAYAGNPLRRTVGVDSSHYKPPAVEVWRRWADQVPPDFRFLVKAHEACTLARWPKHARYGARVGQPNPLFLDPDYAAEHVVGPTAEGLGARLGVILFQLAPQPMDVLGRPEGLADRLYGFLSRLPKGPAYALEVRNPQLLIPRLGDALAASGTLPCLNVISGMPDLATQARLLPAARAPGLVVRWMLRRDLTYTQARDRFAPFDRLAQPDESTRRALARLILALDKPTLVIANNKAEGCSPLTLRALAQELVACRAASAGPC